MKRISITLLLLSVIYLQGYTQNFELFSKGKLVGIQDDNKKMIVQPRYDKIDILKDHKVFLVTLKNKMGVLSENGKELFPLSKDTKIYACENMNSHLMIFGKTNYLYNITSNELIQINESADMFDTDNQYCKIEEGRKQIFIKDKKYGLLEFPQKILLQPIYDEIRNLPEIESVFLVEQNGKFKFYNSKENTFSFEFEVNYPAEIFRLDNDQYYIGRNDFFAAKMNNQWNLISYDKLLGPIEKFDQINFYIEDENQGNILSKKDGKYGFIDSYGVEQIPFMYEDANWFNEGIASVKLNGKWGAINTANELIIWPLYDEMEPFKGGITKAKIKDKIIEIDEAGESTENLSVSRDKTGKCGFVTKSKKVFIDYKFDDAVDFSEGLAAVNKGAIETADIVESGKWGFINLAGELIIDCKYGGVKDFRGGLACVYLDDKWGIIDYSGNWVRKNEFQGIGSFHDGLVSAQKDDKWGFLNKEGKFEILPQYKRVGEFYNSLAKVEIDGKWGYINKSGNIIIKNIYEDATNCFQDLIGVKLNGKWGYIDRTGKMVIENVYDYVDLFVNDKAKVKKDGKELYINKKGEVVK